MGSMTNFPYGVSSYGAPLNGGLPVGVDSKHIWVAPTVGSDGNDGEAPGNPVKTLLRGYNLLRDGKYDVLHLIGEATADLAASLSWTKTLCSLIGESAPGHMNQRSRIGHSADLVTMIDMSGYGNFISNIYMMHGRGNAANVTALKVSGARNVFRTLHVGSPMHATEGGSANLLPVQLSGAQECLFQDCLFGISTIARTAASALVSFDSGAGRILFDECFFLSMVNGTGVPVMLRNSAVNGIVDWVWLRRPKMLAFSANWANAMASAITNAGTNSGAFILEDPTLVNITDIGIASNLLRTFVNGTSPTAASVGLAVTPTV